MNILETIQKHKLIILGSALGLLIIMLIISVIILFSGTKKQQVDPDEIMISIDPMILCFLMNRLSFHRYNIRANRKKAGLMQICSIGIPFLIRSRCKSCTI